MKAIENLKSEMADINSAISILTLTVTGLNIIQPKGRDYETSFTKLDPPFCCL